jgi:ABC-type transport system substrate-binding protein
VKGNKLTVRLTQVAPDFLARIAMPFFCAIPPDMPLDPKGVRLPPGSGPYYVSENVPNREILLRRNPYYRGPRPVRWDAMRFSMNTNRNASYLQVRKGEADLDLVGIPPAANAQLTRELGINRGRYFVHPAQWINYLALNTARPFFADLATRRAVNYAVDRKALNRLAGLNSGTPNDQVLVPGIPGYKEVTVYPNRPNVAKARALLAGKTGTVVLYAGNDPVSQAQSQLLQQDLGRVGITVKPELYSFAVQIEKAGRRGAPFDMNLIGWIADYPDPYDFINILLDGTRISESNNVNTAYFDDPKYNAKMHAAARLSGDARYRAYGALDIDITRNAAPLAVVGDANVREFTSSKIGCGVYSSVQGGLNIVLLCPRK